MSSIERRSIVARCVVCRGDIFCGDPYEKVESGFYCERHSLPYLRARAERYRELLAAETAARAVTEAGDRATASQAEDARDSRRF